MLSTLLVVGLGTSVAAVQRGQREAQLRQALEQEKVSTELSWLKAQINPHFFFNTLNNIYSLTLLDGERAREAIHRLSRMMRYVLYDTQHGTAQLSQEVQFLQDYIDLMQLRLTDNVRIEFTIPHPLQEASIAPLILLTFVENAFKHGVSTVASSRIHIAMQQPTPDTLEVTVQNSVFSDRPVALDENSGIGLTNTRRRLELLYPGRYTLTVTEQTPEHEYRVHLTLRLR
ncbi:sensor histidine kinase [Hymenobacter sp. HDW8]|uniref:sensor histidine kinase n=1 Tax=Hymenobacter sp. HDW8 TaxID=2714932 RepID=UPI001F0DFA87|nr:histidine kinase [Hymenobacter sp. HDW8]